MKNKNPIIPYEIKPDQLALLNRRVYLYEPITDQTAVRINKELLSLDVQNNDPIFLEINSGGGSIEAGISIINTIKCLKSSVVTIINGIAASMAAVISIHGTQRIIYPDSLWMSHDGAGGVDGSDYTEKILARIAFIEANKQIINNMLRRKTKLTEEDIAKGTHGELWYSPEQCLEKGIVDSYLDDEGKQHNSEELNQALAKMKEEKEKENVEIKTKVRKLRTTKRPKRFHLFGKK